MGRPQYLLKNRWGSSGEDDSVVSMPWDTDPSLNDLQIIQWKTEKKMPTFEASSCQKCGLWLAA